MSSLLRKPSAWLPIALSMIAIAALMIGLAATGAPAHQSDEGTAAHLFQVWLALEIALIAFFAIKWLPRAPKQALAVIVIQIALVITGCAPIFYFKL